MLIVLDIDPTLLGACFTFLLPQCEVANIFAAISFDQRESRWRHQVVVGALTSAAFRQSDVEDALSKASEEMATASSEVGVVVDWLSQRWSPCAHCGWLLPPHSNTARYVCYHDGCSICAECEAAEVHPASHLLVWMNPCLPPEFQVLHETPFWNQLFTSETIVVRVRCDNCKKKRHPSLVHVPSSVPGDEVDAYGKILCPNCADGIVDEDVAMFSIRTLPEELVARGDALSIAREAWCDTCGVHIVGPSFKSISVPDFDLCDACFRARSLDDWRHERHVGFIKLTRTLFTTFESRPRTDHPVVESDAQDVQWWALQQLAGFSSLQILSCSKRETAMMKAFDITHGTFAGIRAVFTTNCKGERSFSKAKMDAIALTVQQLRDDDHPNLLALRRYVAVDVADGNQTLRYCVFPYVEAGSLAEVLSGSHRHICTARHVRNYTRQLLRALAALHAKNRIHGNVQTRTCLVDSTGTIRLAYPLAMWRLLYGVEGDDEGASDRLAAVTRMCNLATVKFLAPEVARGGSRTPASDVYAAGAVMANLFSSRPLCDQWNGTAESLLAHIVSNPAYPQPVFVHRNEAFSHRRGLDLCRRLLAVDPEERPTCAETLDDPYFNSDDDNDDCADNGGDDE